MQRFLGLSISAFVSVIALCLCAGQALATPVQCGDVITQDATLDHDLLGCDSGLTVLGDVTLDLNGHVISGTGGGGTGIAASHGSPTILNGTVSGFETGVAIGLANAYISRVTATGNGVGFEAQHASVFFDRDIATRNRSDGFRAFTTMNNAVEATFLRNRADWNGALGINAGDGQTDAGKNHAHKNGDPRQCVGIVCKP
jgi:hypothetical protein